MSVTPVSQTYILYLAHEKKKRILTGFISAREANFLKIKNAASIVSSRSAQKCNVPQTGVTSDTGVSDIGSYTGWV